MQETLAADEDLQNVIDQIQVLRLDHSPFTCQGLARYTTCPHCDKKFGDPWYGKKLKNRLDAWSSIMGGSKHVDPKEPFDPTAYS